MRHIASVMQEPVLFATTIKANIVYGLQDGEEPSLEKIEECARSANAWEFITRFADGLDTAGAPILGSQY
jgi:ABC-type multidrug transport system fused ATPase/permease subunit